MKKKMIFALLGMVTFLLAGCAEYDHDVRYSDDYYGYPSPSYRGPPYGYSYGGYDRDYNLGRGYEENGRRQGLQHNGPGGEHHEGEEQHEHEGDHR